MPPPTTVEQEGKIAPCGALNGARVTSALSECRQGSTPPRPRNAPNLPPFLYGLVADGRGARAGSGVKARSMTRALLIYFRDYILVILGIILLVIESSNRRIVPLNRIHVGFVEYSANERFVHIWCSTEGMLNQINLCMTPFNH